MAEWVPGSAEPDLSTLGTVLPPSAVLTKLRDDMNEIILGGCGMTARIGGKLGKNDRLPGPLPFALHKRDAVKMSQEPFWVTLKMDGIRFMLVATPRGSFLVDRNFTFRKLKRSSVYSKALAAPATKAKPEGGITILDGELMWDSHTGGHLRFMAFDCCIFRGEPMVQAPMSERLRSLQQCARDCASLTNVPVGIYAKRIIPVAETQRFFDEMEELHADGMHGWVVHDKTHGATVCDGLVFMQERSNFMFKGKESGMLRKWKLDNTLDVLTEFQTKDGTSLVQTVEDAQGDQPALLKMPLFHLDHKNQKRLPLGYMLAKANVWEKVKKDALAAKPDRETVVVECSFDRATETWHLFKGRPDKTKPNHYEVVKDTLAVIAEDLTQEKLLSLLVGKGGGGGEPQGGGNDNKRKRSVPASAQQSPQHKKPKPPPRREHPTITTAVEALAPLVAQWKVDPTLELEGRFTGCTIPANMFDAMLGMLRKRPWSSTSERVEVDEVYGPIRVSANKATGQRVAVRKQPQERCNIKVLDTPWSVCVNLKSETPCSEDPGADGSVPPDRVRVKERYSFVHKHEFSYDLTRVYMGKDEQSARQTAAPQFELEIECLRAPQSPRSNLLNKPDEIVAASLLYKFINLLGKDIRYQQVASERVDPKRQ